MLGGHTQWTKSMWDKTYGILDYVLTDDEARVLAGFLFSGDSPFHTKSEHLTEFYRHPPTVLLGAFDELRGGEAVYVRSDIEVAGSVSRLRPTLVRFFR